MCPRGVKRGKTSDWWKRATGAKRGKTSNTCQARENVRNPSRVWLFSAFTPEWLNEQLVACDWLEHALTS